MATFPVDVPKARVVKALEQLDFRLVREGPHLALVRRNPDETQSSLIIPNHSDIRGSTLRTLCVQAGLARDEFLKAYDETRVQVGIG
jgi:predicted RNA binding protein YcfA (HicA-like mRNA interferase family)